jgi:predicted alpha/beta-hydrolase family hydrolase
MIYRRMMIEALALSLCLCLLSGCGPKATPTPTPIPTPEPVVTQKVSFQTEDGIMLAGTLFKGDTDLAVVLAHQGAGQPNQKSWHAFAEAAARSGITALAFDFRKDFGGPLDKDVVAAIRVLRGRGYARIACIGASMGGTSCLKAGLTERLAGIGIIGSAWSTGGNVSIEPQELAALTMPKLFVTTNNDRFAGIAATVKGIYEAAPEPKQFQEYPGTAHGTEIFGTASRDDFRALLLGFLEGLPQR